MKQNSVEQQAAIIADLMKRLNALERANSTGVKQSEVDAIAAAADVGGWTSFTPSMSNLNLSGGQGTAGTHDAWYRYVPGGMALYGIIKWNDATVVGGTVSMTIPNSETVPTASINVPIGTCHYQDADSLIDEPGVLFLISTSSFRFSWTDGNWRASTAWLTGVDAADHVGYEAFIPLH